MIDPKAKEIKMTLIGTFTHSFEREGYYIEYTAIATCDYYYRPGRMYMRNGDPGYPEEESYDDIMIDDVEELIVYRHNPDTDEDEELSEEQYNSALINEWVDDDFDTNADEGSINWQYD